MLDDIRVRLLTAKDVPFAMKLTQLAAWNQSEADWLNFISYEPKGCFLVEYQKIPAATGIALNYQHKLGWIGMVLVHPNMRRKGLGKAVMNRAISYLKDLGVDCIKLDATPMGRNLYLNLEFTDEYKLERLEGLIWTENQSLTGPSESSNLRQMKLEDIKDVAEYDGEIFGVRRDEIINGLFMCLPKYSYVYKDGNKVMGYILCRKGTNAYHIGPWIAEDFQIGKLLYNFIAKDIEGEKVFIDIIQSNNDVRDFLKSLGYTVKRDFVRMYRGVNKWPGKPWRIYSISGPEKG